MYEWSGPVPGRVLDQELGRSTGGDFIQPLWGEKGDISTVQVRGTLHIRNGDSR